MYKINFLSIKTPQPFVQKEEITVQEVKTKEENESLSDEIESTEKEILFHQTTVKNLEVKLEDLRSKKSQRDKKYGPLIDLINSDEIDVAVFVQLLNKKKKK